MRGERVLPPAERLDQVDVLHGHAVADPYRWLESVDDPRTVAWSAQQDDLARAQLAALPGRAQLRGSLAALLRAGSVTPPIWRGKRAFYTRREAGQEHAVLLVREADGTDRVLIDPIAIDPAGTTTLDSWMPSVEGERLVYQISVGGNEESLLHVIDVESGDLLDGPIDRCRYSPVAWLPGGEQLYYVRRLPPEAVPADEEQFHRRVWRHVIGSDPADDVEVHGGGLDPTNYYDVHVSRDGRWLTVSASAGTAPRDDVWIADLAADGALADVQVGVDARCRAWVSYDGRLYLLTDRDAPRGRLCVTNPETPAYGDWREVVPESATDVLHDVALVDGPHDGPLILTAHGRDASSGLSVIDPTNGTRICTVDLPAVGSVVGLTAHPGGGQQAWIGYTDFTTAPSVLSWDSGSPYGTGSWEQAPGAAPEVSADVTEMHFPSADGTTIHLFVVSPDGQTTGPRPTVLYGYGGFNVALEPAYSATMLTWVAAGGVWAVANLRGGSENGEAWHRTGMRAHKQNVFDDFAAAATALVDGGWTTTPQLAIMGGSNGGLLVGAALTQHPELYAAVVCSAPLLDMVRYEQFGLGRTWNDEYGTAADAEELGWLLGYSPYHRVVPGTAYPAVLFTTFDSDTRVDPLHARKTCAAVQHATTGSGPVLLRRELHVGHGARSVSRTLDLAVDQLAFMAAQTGLAVP
ncbi:MAG: prolyl oligopeptidase family serine peptidase [Geodermatophilaceae bacterium]